MLLRERKAVVTGGPTREWLDPVRFISNPSSGKMGVALADECLTRARDTVLIHGPIDAGRVANKKYRCLRVETTDEMLAAVRGEIEENAVLIMSAAPADYSPVVRAEHKIKKSAGTISLELKKTPDILREIALMKKEGVIHNLFTAGFAAETNNIVEYALKKLDEKSLDMICLNDVTKRGAGFGIDTNIITIYMKDGSRVELPMISKRDAAVRILDEVAARLPKYLSQR